MGRKESNQTNKRVIYVLRFLFSTDLLIFHLKYHQLKAQNMFDCIRALVYRTEDDLGQMIDNSDR